MRVIITDVVFWSRRLETLTQIKKSSGAGTACLLDKLYQRTANHLKGIAILYLTDKSHIEDTVEETFVRVIRYIDRFNEASDGYNWMCKITGKRGA